MGDPDDLLKPWRDLVARLISQNIELQRQVEELQRAKADSPVEALAASALRSIRAGEAALAEESGGGRRFVIAEVQANFRGIVQRQGEGLALRLPLPEHAATPGHLGNLSMTFAQVPSPARPAADHTATLTAAWERLQAAFSVWERGPGSASARAIVDQLTSLLAAPDSWGSAAFVRAVHGLAETTVKYGATLRQLPPKPVRAYREAAQRLLSLAEPLARLERMTSDDYARLVELSDQLTLRQQALVLERGAPRRSD